MRMVQVTQEDIAEGRRGSTLQCPVARAMCRSLDNENVFVNLRDAVAVARVYDKNDRFVEGWWLPKSVRLFILAFDGRQPVTPFEFDLDQCAQM